MKTEKEKKPVGRPISKNPRSIVGRCKLTEEESMRIEKSKYKNFRTFVRAMLKKLPAVVLAMIILQSCGGSGAGSSASAPGSVGKNTSGNMYAISLNTQRQYSLGYDVSYTCSGNTCTFAGELHHYRFNNSDLTIFQINTGTLTDNGSGVYTGTFCDNSANCYAAQVRLNTKIVIESAGKCTQTAQVATQASYDAFVGSFGAGLVSNPSALFFNQLTGCSI